MYAGILQALMGHAPGSKVTNRHYVKARETAKRKAALSMPIDWENAGAPNGDSGNEVATGDAV